jgi:hypothetical protein
MRQARLLAALALVGLVAVAASPASARRTEWIYDKEYDQDRSMQIDVVGFLWPFGSKNHFGAAGWFGLPLLESGFIPLNDSLFLEVGTYVAWYQWDLGRSGGEEIGFLALVPTGGVRWNLHLTPEWTVFLTAKIGYRRHLGSDGRSGLVPSFSFGALWHLSKHMAIRLETGNYGVLMAGLSFPF